MMLRDMLEQTRGPCIRQIKEVLETLVATAATLKMDAAVADLTAVLQRLLQETFQVIVIGTPFRGTSTLVNALLGPPVQPVSELAADQGLMPTGNYGLMPVLTRITYADIPFMRAWNFDGTAVQWVPSELWQTLLVPSEEEEGENASVYDLFREFELGYPSAVCRAGLTLLDATWYDANPRAVALIREVISRCDAAILLLSSQAQASLEEGYLFSELSTRGPRVFTVVNLYSALDDHIEQLKRYVWKKVVGDWQLGPAYTGQDLAAQGIYFVNAAQAQQGSLLRDEPLWHTSGMGLLEQSLGTFLMHERLPMTLSGCASAAMRAAAAVRQGLPQPKVEVENAWQWLTQLREGRLPMEGVVPLGPSARADRTTLSVHTHTPGKETKTMSAEGYTYEAAEKRAEALVSGLRRLAAVVADMTELSQRIKDLKTEAKHVEEGRFTIVVLGAFNRGKSTLLNAMLGRAVLPMAAVPSTAIITLLRYHPVEQITVYFNDKDKRPSNPLSVQEFTDQFVLPVVEEIEAELGAEGGNGALAEADLEQQRLEAARDKFSPIAYAEVGFPCELCRHGVEFVDSPGFEDDKARTERAKAFLEKSDAVLFLLDATQSVTDQDTKTLDWIMSQGQRVIFFVINKWNILEIMERTPAGRDKVEQRLRSRLVKYVADTGADGYNERVFKVNALGAFDARVATPLNQAELEKSNMLAFERTLERFLVEGRTQARDNALVAKARSFCERVDKAVEERLRLRAKKLEDLIAARDALRPKLEQLRGVRRHIEDFIDGHLVRIQKRLAESLGTHMARLDVPDLVRNRLNLSVITDTWLTWEGVKDVARRVAEWTGLAAKDETKRFEAQVRQSLEPQLQQLLEAEVQQWEGSTATLQMKDEGQKLIAYLRQEAADYQRILTEIGQLLQEQTPEQLQVEAQVTEWLKTTITRRRSVFTPQLDPTGLAIDLAPMMGAIAVDLALHIKGLAVPIVGTIITICLQFWRQAKTEEKIIQGIENGLRQSLANIPTAEQRKQIDESVNKSGTELKETVLTNINIQIAEREQSLNTAIEDVQKGDFNATAEQARLIVMQDAMRKELAAIELACAGSGWEYQSPVSG